MNAFIAIPEAQARRMKQTVSVFRIGDSRSSNTAAQTEALAKNAALPVEARAVAATKRAAATTGSDWDTF